MRVLKNVWSSLGNENPAVQSSSQNLPTKLVRKMVQESSSLEGIDLTKIGTHCEIHGFTDVIRPGLGVMFN